MRFLGKLNDTHSNVRYISHTIRLFCTVSNPNSVFAQCQICTQKVSPPTLHSLSVSCSRALSVSFSLFLILLRLWFATLRFFTPYSWNFSSHSNGIPRNSTMTTSRIGFCTMEESDCTSVSACVLWKSLLSFANVHECVCVCVVRPWHETLEISNNTSIIRNLLVTKS